MAITTTARTLLSLRPSTLLSRSYASSSLRTARASSRRRPLSPEPERVLFQSLGCPRNLVDTEVMMGVTTEHGLVPTNELAHADYVVVNTCGFLESAREESNEAIREFLQTKPPNTKVIVTGCMVNLHQHQIYQDFPQVDSILGSGKIDQIVETIESLRAQEDERTRQHALEQELLQDQQPNDNPSVSTASAARRRRKSFLESGDTPRFLSTPPHYAYLKIAEGCKKQCAFCIIPKIKGRLRSKPIDQIVQEYTSLLEASPMLSEVILIAQDLGDYGKDFVQPLPQSHLTNLLRALLEATDTLPDESRRHNMWIRLLYLYPDEITPDLLNLLEEDPRICRYLDMPIQHSHNDMLKLMRRKTSTDDIRRTIRSLRQRLPDVHIRTSLMVGFPGETEEHFQHLLDFVREEQLDNVGVFTYSDEPMAYSSKLPNHVPEEIKQDRYHRLMEAQYEIVQQKNDARVGEHLDVVVEGLNGDGQVVGRYYGQCPDIDGQVILSTSTDADEETAIQAGKRYTVQVTGHADFDLVGEIVETD